MKRSPATPTPPANAERVPPPYPGIPTTLDGTGAVVWVETHISQGACAFPITPSTNMGVQFAQAVAGGARNLWGEPLAFLESESEHSSASAAEGFALAGGRVTNFTSGQGLVLMQEVLYVIAGKRLPVVFNIGARALTSQALNVHAGHDDVMAVADTGWGMLFARNAQEAADLCLIARRTAEATETPFFNVQDGFLTTHTLESARLPEEALMKEYIGAPGERLQALFDPKRGLMSGVVQNQDAYMRGKIAQRIYYDKLHRALLLMMEEYSGLTGRRYRPVCTYRMEDADFAIVALGSIAETAELAADHVRAARGLKAGVVHPTAFRPFPGALLVDQLKHVRAIAVIERLDIPSAENNPLTAQLKAAFADALTGREGYPLVHRIPVVVSGSAGLGGRDVSPGDLVATYEELARGRRDYFSLNIAHPTALKPASVPDLRPKGAFSLRGYSIGGFGSVTTNKVIAEVSAELFGVHVQAYPKYGSEKKGLPTNYYLTLAPERIRSHSEMDEVEFIPLNDVHAMQLGNAFAGLSPGGTVFIQWKGADPVQLWNGVPPASQRALKRVGARVYYLDAARIAEEQATQPSLVTRMQGIVLLGVFLRCAPFRHSLAMDDAALFAEIEKALRHAFPRVSDRVIQENLLCVRRGYTEVLELPRAVIDRAGEGDQARFAGKRVADVMHSGVITCHPTDPLPQVVRTMRDAHISAIVVVDGGQRMAGILSTTDLTRAMASSQDRGRLPDVLPQHLMTSDVLVTWPEEPLADAVNRMLEHHVHRLVVVPNPRERLRPVGILSMTDVAHVVA